MEQPKARLTPQQQQQAINEAIWIDASPHEWPTVDKMWLLCSALIDSAQTVDFLRTRLAAAQAGEARAVEALREVAAVTNQLGPDKASGQYMAESAHKIASTLLADSQPALDWLAQREAESVATWIEKQVADNLQRYGTHYYERTTDDLLREAAALRAGKGVGDA